MKHGDTSRARAAQKRGHEMTLGEFEEQLTDDIAQFYDDFNGFVMYAFEWGKGELAEFDGPDAWQKRQQEEISARLKKEPMGNIRYAISSGHGIGKTAEVAWLILWCMSTRPHLAGVVTANTMSQLNTKTWRELALWWKRLINRHWFKWSATKFWHVDHPETWSISAIPNSEHNSQAFAGLHSKYKLIIYDEASTIPDKIWEVSEGAMTDPGSIWCVFGNPTENVGRFKRCFYEDKRRWISQKVDSRTVKMTNKAELNDQVEAYGEDSDFVRIRIRGEFPRLGTMQFIATDVVDKAILTDFPFESYCLLPIVIGVDVARYGDDKSVIAIRQGRKLHEVRKFRELNTMQLAVEVVSALKEYKAGITFVDSVGVGAGVVDRLRMLGYEVCEVNGGVPAHDDEQYYNKTAEMYAEMRSWLMAGADIPNDNDLRNALIGREFGFDDKERIRMERKKDMKRRGLDSPDEADALAHTFAEPIGDIKRQWFEPDMSFEPEYPT